MNNDEVKQSIHYKLKPFFAIVVRNLCGVMGINKIIDHKKEHGHTSELCKRLYPVFNETRIELREEIKKIQEEDWELDSTLQYLSDFIVAIMDSERYWSPIGWNIFIRKLKEHNLIDGIEEPKRINKTETKQDKYGNIYSRIAVDD